MFCDWRYFSFHHCFIVMRIRLACVVPFTLENLVLYQSHCMKLVFSLRAELEIELGIEPHLWVPCRLSFVARRIILQSRARARVVYHPLGRDIEVYISCCITLSPISGLNLGRDCACCIVLASKQLSFFYSHSRVQTS